MSNDKETCNLFNPLQRFSINRYLVKSQNLLFNSLYVGVGIAFVRFNRGYSYQKLAAFCLYSAFHFLTCPSSTYSKHNLLNYLTYVAEKERQELLNDRDQKEFTSRNMQELEEYKSIYKNIPLGDAVKGLMQNI